MDLDFACVARSSDACASYPVLVHRLAPLIHASSPLRITNPSPPSGWVEDFDTEDMLLLVPFRANEHARHMTKPLRGGAAWQPRSHPIVLHF